MSADQVFELTSPPARRGRPRKEGALTNAQRQAAYKQRLKEAAEQASSVSNEYVQKLEQQVAELQRRVKAAEREAQMCQAERSSAFKAYAELEQRFEGLQRVAQLKGFA